MLQQLHVHDRNRNTSSRLSLMQPAGDAGAVQIIATVNGSCSIPGVSIGLHVTTCTRNMSCMRTYTLVQGTRARDYFVSPNSENKERLNLKFKSVNG